MYQSLRHTYIMRTYVICRCQIAIRPKPSSAVPFARLPVFSVLHFLWGPTTQGKIGLRFRANPTVARMILEARRRRRVQASETFQKHTYLQAA